MNLPGFARFLPVAALSHGQVLNVAGLARDAGVARTTIAGYLDIPFDTHLAWFVPGFEARLRVKERQHPKLYCVDPGIVRAVRRERHAPTAAERGPLFEGWVALMQRAYGDPDFGLGTRYDELSYWAPSGSGAVEVDFAVRRGKTHVAVEAKAKTALGSRDLKGLRAIAPLGGLRRRLVVFLGERPFHTEDGIEALPVAAFLQELEEGRL